MVAFAWQLSFSSWGEAVSFRHITSMGNKERMGRREELILKFGLLLVHARV